jgi:hypothetical protein
MKDLRAFPPFKTLAVFCSISSGCRLESAWYHVKLNRASSMRDTSGSKKFRNEIKDHPGRQEALPSEAPVSHNDRGKPNNIRKGSKNVALGCKRMWQRILKAVNWIDTRGPFISALATVVIAILTAYYVHYSRTANLINQQAANAATSAAETASREFVLAKTRLEAQDQAIVNLATADLDIRNSAAGITLSNSGQIAADDVTADFSITRETLPDKKVIWKSSSYKLESSRLAKNASISRNCPVPGVSLDNWPIDPDPPYFWAETIRVEGVISYGNGFGTTVKQKFCESYLRYFLGAPNGIIGKNGWVSCDELSDTVSAEYPRWLKQIRDKRK